MLLPSTSIHETEENEADVPLLSALLQLKQFQQASTCHCPLPLVILVPGSDTGVTQKLEEGDSESTSQIILLHTLNPFLMNVGTILNTPRGVFLFSWHSALVLQELVGEDLISEYKFFFIPESSCDLRGCRQVAHNYFV